MKNKRRIEDELSAIASAHNGRLTPNMIVQAAKKKGSALHAHFTERGCFDPKKSMEQWQIEVARDVLQSCKVVFHTETHTITAPAYIRDPDAAPMDQGYVSLSKLRTEDELARNAVVHEFSCAGAALRRAQDLAHALSLSDEIGDLYGRVVALKERIQTADHPREQ